MKLFGKNFFELFDFASSNVLLPVGGLAIAAGGRLVHVPQRPSGELNRGYAGEPWHGRLVYGVIKFVAPVLILLILLTSLGVIKI